MAVNSPDLRVAIVGAGPRGLWAAEELLDQARTHGVRVAVDVWDDRPPGTGSAYDTEQPDYWTMNVSSHIVTSALGSFDGWRRQVEHESDANPFPPRALVGRFFAESWQALLDSTRHPDSGCTLRFVASRVTDLGELDGYDEVLLATGHARTWPGALAPTIKSQEIPAVPVVGVYPPDGLRRIAAGAVVDVRGAALTFVDAALELTLGRGGTVVPADGGWVYRRGGSEPASIRPFSRTGRFMSVKPEPGSLLAGLLPSGGLADEERRVRVSRDLGELREAVACAADRLLATAQGAEDGALVRRIIAGTDTGTDAVAELRRSHAVATGTATPDATWAVGHAWRSLYPAIVWRTSHGRRSTLPGFAALARTLERVAFGLPPHNAAWLLALIDAGIVHAPAHAEVRTLMPPADVVVDAVLAPAGDVPGTLASGIGNVTGDGTGPGWVGAAGQVVGRPGLSVVGRDADAALTGADSLNRSLHDMVPRWARRVVKAHGPRRPGKPGQPGAEGTVPLPARLEPWMVELLGDAGACRALLEEHGSPVNVLRTAPMVRNMAELRDAGTDSGVETRVFYARKANKALCFVDTAVRAGHGVDVASERELRQVLDRGVPGDRVILSAAVKPDRLLRLAVDNAVTVSVDNLAELHRLSRLGRLGEHGDGGPAVRARVAPRVSPDPAHLPPTRFGERPATWRDALVEVGTTVEVVGAHVHLHGYSAADRRLALTDALQVTDAATELGHRPEFVDLGGGVPMSYLDDESRWEAFLDARRAMVDGTGAPFTWKSDPLANTYPFHQSPVRGDWLRGLLDGSAADALIRRGLRLHLEPGRAVLDGCGMILARVAFLKDRSDGVPLVGVEMNRTQCRTTSDDILVDPLLVRQRTSGTGPPGRPERGPGAEGFLVGAYCIEDEVIIRRRMRFPEGISTGDTLVIPNTAGYFMHILESASHQIPLARNVVLDVVLDGALDGAQVDDIDR